MKKNVTIISFILASLLVSVTIHAAVPLHWTVESSRTSLAQLEAYQGETLALEAAMQSAGKPLELSGIASLYWQTNGMGSAYWETSAAVNSNRLSAVFTPEMDVGAKVYNCFIGVPGTIYHAAFQLRLRPSPGATPNVLPLPVPVIDFAKVRVLNPPWEGGGGGSGVDTNAVEIIANRAVETNAVTVGLSSSVSGLHSSKLDKTSVDPTLTTNGVPADAKATGDVLERKVSSGSSGYLSPSFPGPAVGWGVSEYGGAGIVFGNGFNANGTIYLYDRISRDYGNKENLIPDRAGTFALDDETSLLAMLGDAAPSNLASHPTFSNAVLSVGLNIDTNNGVMLTNGVLQTKGGTSITPGNVGAYTKEEVNGLVEDAGKVKTVAGQEPDASGNVSLSPSTIGAATQEEVNAAMTAANDANIWSSATFNFMTGGRTNCWFSGTNYVFGTDAAARTRFAWEDGMDAATVPCSMALWEIRDGVRQIVWDQRDWTAWYWSFKANQIQTNVTAQIAALGRAVTNDSNYAWAKRYASDGTPNPDASTTFIDTPSVTLSPGMKWETVATVSGAAYWTIVGDGAIIGGSGTNAVLRIQDFEGNDIMTVTKGEHRLAWIERGEITGQMYDGDGWVCFDMLADAEPIGYFSTTLDSSDFLPQTDPNCPAQYEWEDLHNGKYRIHYLLKPGIQSNACFAKFQVEVEGQTIIRYNAGQEISGGLIYNGVKIAPDISGSPAVGTVIQWKVVH